MFLVTGLRPQGVWKKHDEIDEIDLLHARISSHLQCFLKEMLLSFNEKD